MRGKSIWVAATACLIAVPTAAQTADNAVLVKLKNGVETGYLPDPDTARRELAARVEMAARMACADAWTPRNTVYESIRYKLDWAGSDRARPGQRKAIARDISVQCAP